MFGLGFPELVVILVVVLFIFGFGKLPEIGSALGQGLRDFQRASGEHDRAKEEAENPKSVDTHEDAPPPSTCTRRRDSA